MWINRIVSCFIALSVGIVALGEIPTATVLGEAPEKMVGPMGEYVNLTSLGMMSVVLIFIVMKMLPDLHQKIAAIPTKHGELFTNAIMAIMEKAEKREEIRDARFQGVMVKSSEAMNNVAKSLALLERHCKAKREGDA